MKRITLLLAAIVVSFVLSSCSVSTKDAIIKDVDNFFTQAEQKLGEISNAEDFLNFVDALADKSELIQLLEDKYGDKTLSEEDNEAVQKFIQERASAYNHAEAEKAAEYLTPLIENYENAVNALYNAVGKVDEETFHQLTENFEKAEEGLRPFAAYDNVLPELQKRAQAADAKLKEMIKTAGEE